MKQNEATELCIQHDRDYTSFADIARFVDQVRARYPKYTDSVIDMYRDPELSDHEMVNFKVD